MEKELHSYEIKIWEKAEHWYFYQTYQAESHEAAIEMARKEYKSNAYTVVG